MDTVPENNMEPKLTAEQLGFASQDELERLLLEGIEDEENGRLIPWDRADMARRVKGHVRTRMCMAVHDVMARLQALAAEFDESERPSFHPPARPEDVAEFQAIAGFTLSPDLREFLSLSEAIVAMDVHNGYWVGGLHQLNRSAECGDFPRTIEGQAAIPVATDGGGNAFLQCADERVWRWDHETGRLRPVANSFAAFLERVAEDWEAFLAQTAGWTYLV